MNPLEFARKIKDKYPQYKDVDDLQLARDIIVKYPQYAQQVDFTKVSPVKETSDFIGDIQETASGLRSDIESRADKFGEIGSAERSGEQGSVRSLFQRFGQGLGAASDVIGRTVVGAGKALLPQRAEEAIGGAVERGVSSVAETRPVQGLLQRYETIKQTNPAFARDIDAALGIGLLTADLASMGVGGQALKTGLRGAGRVTDTVASGVAKTGAGTRRIGFELEGALTGTSQETLEAAFQAARQGGKQLDALTQNIRGQFTPESLVENVKDAVSRVRSTNSTTYKENLAPIVGEIVNTTALPQRISTKLQDFGISVKNGQLDFSQSKFRTVPQAQGKIQQTYNEVLQLGDNPTLGQIDTTRQALRELTLTGDDASARSANAIIEEAINSVRDAGKQVDGYEPLLSNFAENAEFLDEITRSLSTGDRATIDNTYRKLTTSLKTNNERRMNLLTELDEITDGAILGSISGQQLSEVLPRGLFRQIGAGLAGAGVVTGGVSSGLIVPMVFASPKVAGEFVRALGLTAAKTDTIIQAIADVRRTLDKLDLSLPVVSPLTETNEQ